MIFMKARELWRLLSINDVQCDTRRNPVYCCCFDFMLV